MGACAAGWLGAAIGFGVATALAEVLPALSQYSAWGGVCGAILLVGLGAWRLSAKLSPVQRATLQLRQAFVLGENGFDLSTDTARTHMDWAHFLAAGIEPHRMVLRTRDETIVLLRPAFFASPADWNEAMRMVGAHIPASSGM